MDAYSVYRDIQKRTKGQFLIGVVGPVRTGKSTLIRRFLEVLALPYLSEKEQAEVRDALPLSGEGKTITTVEPKFVPKDAVELQLGEGDPIRLRLIDCVGFLVPDAAGNLENEKERMVKTPWSEQAIPFREAAEIGTKKVIAEHSTIGLMVTCDGSFGELPRENFLQAEERTVAELKKQGKPFLILVNAKKPYREETQRQVKELETKFGVAAMAVNCDQLRKEDILHMLEKVLYEFPLQQMEFYIPKWVELLADDHPLKAELLQKIRRNGGCGIFHPETQSMKRKQQPTVQTPHSSFWHVSQERTKTVLIRRVTTSSPKKRKLFWHRFPDAIKTLFLLSTPAA